MSGFCGLWLVNWDGGRIWNKETPFLVVFFLFGLVSLSVESDKRRQEGKQEIKNKDFNLLALSRANARISCTIVFPGKYLKIFFK